MVGPRLSLAGSIMDPLKYSLGIPNHDERVIDTLTDVERDALTRIRAHEGQLDAFRRDMATVRARATRPTGSSSIAELRRLVGDADALEALLGMPRELLESETLIEAEWPTTDLTEARKMLVSVDACELATARARGQIEASDHDVTPSSMCMTLNDLITSWSELRKTEADARKGVVLAVQRVDLAVEARARTIRLLCVALLDKAIEVHEGLLQKTKAPDGDLDTTISADNRQQIVIFGQRLRSFLEQDWVHEALKALQVEVPRHDVFQARPTEAVDTSTTSTPATDGVHKIIPPWSPDSETEAVPGAWAEAAAEGRSLSSPSRVEHSSWNYPGRVLGLPLSGWTPVFHRRSGGACCSTCTQAPSTAHTGTLLRELWSSCVPVQCTNCQSLFWTMHRSASTHCFQAARHKPQHRSFLCAATALVMPTKRRPGMMIPTCGLCARPPPTSC